MSIVDQNTRVFPKASCLSKSRFGRNKVLGKMEEMVSDISVETSVFQPHSFINSLNYSGTFKEERRDLSLTADVNWQLMGWKGKEQGPRETSGRRREKLSSVHFLCLGLQPHATHHS